MLTAVLIQVLVLVLTLAAAGGSVPMPCDRHDATTMVDASGTVRAPACRSAGSRTDDRARGSGSCPSLTAGRVTRWIDQGRGPMPPPMA